jgi:zona occludens toxin (predicted ATPase)
MKSHFTGLAFATLLVAASALPGYAEDAAAPAAPPAPAANQTEAPPASVARPSLAPKAAEPASQPVAAEPSPSQRRYAHRHWRRYGYYRSAYWQPFPIFWPHFYRSRIHWSRIPWAFNF